MNHTGIGDDEALRLAAAVERDAEHPVARATVHGRRLAVGGPNPLQSV